MREKQRDRHGLFAPDNTSTLCALEFHHHQGMRLIQPDQTSAVRTSASATAQVSSEMRQPDFCMALCASVRASSETISCSAMGAICPSSFPKIFPKIKNPLAGFGASERVLLWIAVTKGLS